MTSWLRALTLGLLSAALIAPVVAAQSSEPGGNGGDHGDSVDLDTPAAQLRVGLDRLLAEHAFLTIEQMRSGLTDSPDFAAAAAAVEANSTEVANAIGEVYGPDAATSFGDIWRAHIGYVVDYAVALGRDDSDGRQAALDGLAGYRSDLGEFFAQANPGVALEGVAEALEMHDAHLIEFIDAVHGGDHVRAYEIERLAYPHMFDIGDALARLIATRFPDRFGGLDVAYSAAGTLRVTLDRVLAEHAFLAAEAMRAGIAGETYFDASQDALEANSAELEGLVAAAYGADAGTSFREFWDGHNEAYIAYIDVVRQGDQAARASAVDLLERYVESLSAFLAGANPHLDAEALTSLLQEHTGHLTGQVDAFAAGDYEATYELVRDGYRHMFAAGEALAAAIAAHMPDKFPATAGAPDTATLDSEPAGSAWAWIMVGALVIGLVGALALQATPRLKRGAARPDRSTGGPARGR